MSEENDDYQFTFSWIIENISLASAKPDYSIRSPLFKVESPNHCEWSCKLYLRTGISENNISCYLERWDRSLNNISVRFEFEISDAHGEILCYGKTRILFTNGDSSGLCNLFSNSKVMKYIKDSADDFITVQCKMASEEFHVKLFKECSVRSKINFDYTSFLWSFDFFDTANSSINKIIFFYGNDYQFKINMTINNEDNVKINILKINKSETDLNSLICRIVLLDNNNIEQICKRDIYWFEDSQEWNFPLFIKKSFLLAFREQYIKNGKIQFKCEFWAPREKVMSEIKYFHSTSLNTLLKQEKPRNSQTVVNAETFLKLQSLNILQNNFRDMFVNDIESDVKVKHGDKVFSAHRCVLAARSPVFHAMFNQNMTEKTSGVIEIPDVEYEILNVFLLYLYTGEMELSDGDQVVELLLVAEKYQVTSLKEKCCFILMSNLNVKNVCEILLLSDMIKHEALQTSAVNFIKSHSSEVLSSKEWAQCAVKNMQLASNVFCELSIGLSDAARVLGM